jgi:hypothetical protein
VGGLLLREGFPTMKFGIDRDDEVVCPGTAVLRTVVCLLNGGRRQLCTLFYMFSVGFACAGLVEEEAMIWLEDPSQQVLWSREKIPVGGFLFAQTPTSPPDGYSLGDRSQRAAVGGERVRQTQVVAELTAANFRSAVVAVLFEFGLCETKACHLCLR